MRRNLYVYPYMWLTTFCKTRSCLAGVKWRASDARGIRLNIQRRGWEGSGVHLPVRALRMVQSVQFWSIKVLHVTTSHSSSRKLRGNGGGRVVKLYSLRSKGSGDQTQLSPLRFQRLGISYFRVAICLKRLVKPPKNAQNNPTQLQSWGDRKSCCV